MANQNTFRGPGYVKESTGSTARQVFGSTGDLYSNGTPLNYTETGSTGTNLKAYGHSQVTYSTAAANKYTLDAPIVGIEKILTMTSTKVMDSTSVVTTVYTGSTAIFIRNNTTTYSADNALPLYVSMQPPYSCVKLIGLTTALWGIVGTYGAVQFSTQQVYSS